MKLKKKHKSIILRACGRTSPEEVKEQLKVAFGAANEGQPQSRSRRRGRLPVASPVMFDTVAFSEERVPDMLSTVYDYINAIVTDINNRRVEDINMIEERVQNVRDDIRQLMDDDKFWFNKHTRGLNTKITRMSRKLDDTIQLLNKTNLDKDDFNLVESLRKFGHESRELSPASFMTPRPSMPSPRPPPPPPPLRTNPPGATGFGSAFPRPPSYPPHVPVARVVETPDPQVAIPANHLSVQLQDLSARIELNHQSIKDNLSKIQKNEESLTKLSSKSGEQGEKMNTISETQKKIIRDTAAPIKTLERELRQVLDLVNKWSKNAEANRIEEEKKATNSDLIRKALAAQKGVLNK